MRSWTMITAQFLIKIVIFKKLTTKLFYSLPALNINRFTSCAITHTYKYNSFDGHLQRLSRLH